MTYHWTVEGWWQAEQVAGKWWDRRTAPSYEPHGTADRIALWLHSFCTRRRYAAEREHPRL